MKLIPWFPRTSYLFPRQFSTRVWLFADCAQTTRKTKTGGTLQLQQRLPRKRRHVTEHTRTTSQKRRATRSARRRQVWHIMIRRRHKGPDSQTILGQTHDISYDNILW